MTDPSDAYSTQIIKGGALVQETLTVLRHWRPDETPGQNLSRIRDQRLLGKPTLKREQEALNVLKRRLVEPDGSARVKFLARAVKAGLNREGLLQVLLYFAMRSDPLVKHFCADYLYAQWQDGRTAVNTNELTQHLLNLSQQGRTTSDWSPPTARRVAQGLLSMARDFGVLHGVNPKKLSPPRLSFPAFVAIIFDLHEAGASDRELANSAIWHGFFHNRRRIEDLFVRAQQEGILYYNAAGSTVRIDWLLDDPLEAVVSSVA